jgi:hypothetical protein
VYIIFRNPLDQLFPPWCTAFEHVCSGRVHTPCWLLQKWKGKRSKRWPSGTTFRFVQKRALSLSASLSDWLSGVFAGRAKCRPEASSLHALLRLGTAPPVPCSLTQVSTGHDGSWIPPTDFAASRRRHPRTGDIRGGWMDGPWQPVGGTPHTNQVSEPCCAPHQRSGAAPDQTCRNGSLVSLDELVYDK